MTIIERTKVPSAARFFGSWALLFVVGVLLMRYGNGLWPALGVFIVAPTIITALLMGWGYLVCKIIKVLSGDPNGDYVGMCIFLSFAFLVLPILLALWKRRW